MRKPKRWCIYKVVACLCLTSLIVILCYQRDNDLDRNTQILLIERSIRSPMNKGECRHPQLPIDNPEVMKFYMPVKKIDCGDSLDDWVMCEKSICFVKPEINAIHGEVTCSFTDLIRTTDYKVKYGKTTKTKEPYVLHDSDFVKVVCRAESHNSWYGMAFGIRDGVSTLSAPPRLHGQEEHVPKFNVLMFGFDSLSRNAFIRKLPKSYAYLTQQLDSIVLQGYNIVGDGTPAALIPILTGYTELELPETRKRKFKSNYVDVYPMIWKDYAQKGYYTSFNEDVPLIGTFTYRLNGFDKQPVDHYLRTYYLETRNIWSSMKENCIGHQPDHIVMLDYTKNFMAKYNDAPRFVFSFHGGLSHDSINLVGAADDDVLKWLMALKEKRLLDDTILIMMADHGNRFADVRATLQGKQEERLPFFSFAFPDSFKQRFPQEYQNFVENSERLTTPFDIYATLKDLLDLQLSHEATTHEAAPADDSLTATAAIQTSELAKKRAISLFKSIPRNRSCSDAYIEPHWCACLNWQSLSLNDTLTNGKLLLLASSIVKTINNATSTFRNLCAPLQLERINWALKLQAKKELLHFKQNSDTDGFLADLTGNTQVSAEIYQLQIVVEPGQSLFEASVHYNLSTFEPVTKLSEISRVNKYGAQANCIYELNPELRKYCYCRNT